MNRDTEKKIYELLGVNVFRKYILFTWEKIAGLFHLNVGYRLDDLSMDAIKSYKKRAKGFAIAHVAAFLIGIPLCSTSFSWIYNIFLNLYCIIVQRYNYIRIEEAEEKYTKLQVLREKREKRLEAKRNKKKNDLSIDRINELMSVFNVSPKVNSNPLEKQGYSKVVDAKSYFEKLDANDPFNPNYWLNMSQNKSKTLTRKVG